MATCKDCIHCDVCEFNDGLKRWCQPDYDCPHFENKADVAEVKRGKWEICCDGYYPYCPVCKAEPENGVMSNFCPNCGADMRPLDKQLDKD